jgi:hypothetical protein
VILPLGSISKTCAFETGPSDSPKIKATQKTNLLGLISRLSFCPWDQLLGNVSLQENPDHLIAAVLSDHQLGRDNIFIDGKEKGPINRLSGQ